MGKDKQTMRVGSIAPWFGAKRAMAATIVEELGPHQGYWEPFCGSMAVLMVKPVSAHEHVNDLHGDLIGLARTIQDATWGPWLYRKLRRSLISEDLLNESREVLTGDEDLSQHERAFHFFYVSWVGMNGVGGTGRSNYQMSVRWTTGGGHSTRFVNAVRSMAAWRRRLRCVVILNRDAFVILEKIADRKGVVIYVDPPYLTKGEKYIHDFIQEDHARLAAALRRFKKVRVVVSYYDDPRLGDLYPGWTKRTVYRDKNMVHAGLCRTKGNKVAPEVLLINGPSLAKVPAGSKQRELFTQER